MKYKATLLITFNVWSWLADTIFLHVPAYCNDTIGWWWAFTLFIKVIWIISSRLGKLSTFTLNWLCCLLWPKIYTNSWQISFGLWCLMPLLITIFQLYHGGQFSWNHQPVASHWQTLSHNVVLSTPCHELKKLVVIGTDFTGSSKSNYHTIMTMTAPMILTWPHVSLKIIMGYVKHCMIWPKTGDMGSLLQLICCNQV